MPTPGPWAGLAADGQRVDSTVAWRAVVEGAASPWAVGRAVVAAAAAGRPAAHVSAAG